MIELKDKVIELENKLRKYEKQEENREEERKDKAVVIH